MNVGELRRALEGVSDAMPVLVRTQLANDDLAMGEITEATPDAGCTDKEIFVIDVDERQGSEGEE